MDGAQKSSRDAQQLGAVRQVPTHLIRRMLEMGRYAPSQGNCQPWEFVVVRDADMIQGMEDFCVGACKKLSSGLDYATYPQGSAKHFITRAKARLFNRLRPNLLHPVPITVVSAIAEGRFGVFHRAPTVIFLLMDTRGVGTPEIDIGICGTNIVLAAQSLGLGTCWVGFSKFLNQSREWCARLGAEPPYEITEAITVGYPIGEPTRLIARDTYEIAWFEGRKKDILYIAEVALAVLSKQERGHFPHLDDPTECISHRVAIDLEACDGCRLCALVCPANVLEIYRENGRKKARVKASQRGCISCNNCRAICANDAIGATQANDSVGYYRQLGRGEFAMPRQF